MAVEARDLRRALARLHDWPYLQTHPLAVHRGGVGRGAADQLRRDLLEAVESLHKPGDDGPVRRRYDIVRLHYVEALDADAVCRRLAISRSLFYRELRDGLAALTARLDERWGGASPTSQASPLPGALPAPLDSFVGRRRLLDELRARLRSARLLTLTGPPGTGKTRLAIELARAAAVDCAEGARFVGLGSVVDPDLVPSAIARALGLQPVGDTFAETLAGYLRARQVLLVLDNFEQVIDAAPALVDLLEACSNVSMVVTSRTALRVRGERVHPVPPLDAESEAAQLFVERAQAIDHAFVAEADDPTIRAICRQLDGLPLAIELAAARVRTLTPEQIAARLDARLPVLDDGPRDSPERHRSLRAALDWSYALLGPNEQVFLRQLGVFVGAFSLEAAEAVAADGRSALGSLHTVVGHSLVRRRAGDFVLLETIREYALDRLTAAGGREPAGGRHAAYFRALAGRAWREMLGPAQAEWLARVEDDLPNFRAAARWYLDRGDATAAADLLGSLWRFWHIRGAIAEGRALIEEALAGVAAEAVDPGLARAFFTAGILAYFAGEVGVARARAERALRVARAIGSCEMEGRALFCLGLIAIRERDLGEARRVCSEAIAIGLELGSDQLAASGMHHLSSVHRWEGDYAGAESLLHEALARVRRAGDATLIAALLYHVAVVEAQRGAYASAHERYDESLAISRQLGARYTEAQALIRQGATYMAEGDLAAARRLLDAGLELHSANGARADEAATRGALGQLALDEGDGARAAHHLRAGLAFFGSRRDWPEVAAALAGLGAAAALVGDLERASRLTGAADRLGREHGNPPVSIWRAARSTSVTADLARLVNTPAWCEGAKMDAEAAIGYALEANG